MVKKTLSFIHLCLIINGGLHCQQSFIEDYSVSLYFGIKEVQRDSFANTENLDFMNYMYAGDNYLDYEYIGISTDLMFKGNWETSVQLAFLDDLTLTKLHLSARYFPFPELGFLLGFSGDGMLMNEFSTYHKSNDEGLIGDINTNYRQSTHFDLGMAGGIIYRQQAGRIELDLGLLGGMSTILPFEEKVSQKEAEGNLRRMIYYSTHYSFNPFVMPSAKLVFTLVDRENLRWGLQMQGDWHIASKSIDYDKTVFSWTTAGKEVISVTGPKHQYHSKSLDVGFFVSW